MDNGTDVLPKHIMVAKNIRSYIKSNRLLPGDKLPGGRFFSKLYGTSKNTVYEALGFLQDECIINVRGQSGAYVTEEAWTDGKPGTPKWSDYIECGWQLPSGFSFEDFGAEGASQGSVFLNRPFLHNSFGYADHIKKAMEDFQNDGDFFGVSGPYDLRGPVSVREAVAERLKNRGVGNISPDNIIMTCGVQNALEIVVKSILSRGDTIYSDNIARFKFMSIFSSIGIHTMEVPSDCEGITVKDLTRRMGRSRRPVLLISPYGHCPSGQVMSKERKERLADFCASVKLPIIEIDETGDLYEGSEGAPLLSMGIENMVIHIGSVLMPYSAGMDVGWIIAPDHLTDRISDISAQSGGFRQSLVYRMIEKFITGGYYDSFLGSLREKIKKRWSLADSLLKKHLGSLASWSVCNFGLIVWIKIDERVDMKKMIKNRSGVFFILGEFYSKKYSSYIMIYPCSSSEEELERGISLIGAQASACFHGIF